MQQPHDGDVVGLGHQDPNLLQQPNLSAGIQIPTPASVLPVVPGQSVDMHPRASNGSLRKQKIKHNTTLLDLINNNMLQVGQTLCFIRSSPHMLGTLGEDGTITAEFDTAKYTTIGGFAIAAHRASGGAGKGIDGWRTVKPKDQNMYLATLRAKYEEQHKGAVSYVPAQGDRPSFGANNKATRRENDGPKKPLCAFILYVQTVRSSILEANPLLSGGQLLRRIGQQWTELADHERQTYINFEMNQKQRYDMQLQPGGPSLMSVPEMATHIPPMPAVSIPVMSHQRSVTDIPSIVMPVSIPQPMSEGVPPPSDTGEIDVSVSMHRDACIPMQPVDTTAHTVVSMTAPQEGLPSPI